MHISGINHRLSEWILKLIEINETIEEKRNRSVITEFRRKRKPDVSFSPSPQLQNPTVFHWKNFIRLLKAHFHKLLNILNHIYTYHIREPGPYFFGRDFQILAWPMLVRWPYVKRTRTRKDETDTENVVPSKILLDGWSSRSVNHPTKCQS